MYIMWSVDKETLTCLPHWRGPMMRSCVRLAHVHRSNACVLKLWSVASLGQQNGKHCILSCTMWFVACNDRLRQSFCHASDCPMPVNGRPWTLVILYISSRIQPVCPSTALWSYHVSIFWHFEGIQVAHVRLCWFCIRNPSTHWLSGNTYSDFYWRTLVHTCLCPLLNIVESYAAWS